MFSIDYFIEEKEIILLNSDTFYNVLFHYLKQSIETRLERTTVNQFKVLTSKYTELAKEIGFEIPDVTHHYDFRNLHNDDKDQPYYHGNIFDIQFKGLVDCKDYRKYLFQLVDPSYFNSIRRLHLSFSRDNPEEYSTFFNTMFTHIYYTLYNALYLTLKHCVDLNKTKYEDNSDFLYYVLKTLKLIEIPEVNVNTFINGKQIVIPETFATKVAPLFKEYQP